MILISLASHSRGESKEREVHCQSRLFLGMVLYSAPEEGGMRGWSEIREK